MRLGKWFCLKSCPWGGAALHYKLFKLQRGVTSCILLFHTCYTFHTTKRFLYKAFCVSWCATEFTQSYKVNSLLVGSLYGWVVAVQVPLEGTLLLSCFAKSLLETTIATSNPAPFHRKKPICLKQARGWSSFMLFVAIHCAFGPFSSSFIHHCLLLLSTMKTVHGGCCKKYSGMGAA